MDKNAIKKFATWARRELITRVSQRAEKYEVTEAGYGDANATHVDGRVLTSTEKKQRAALVRAIRSKEASGGYKAAYEQVMEEVAYTWFNRLSAIRYMEVNNYLPSHVRVFTDDEGSFKPQILTEAIHLEMDGLDMEKVYAFKDARQDEQLYRYLLTVQCNALSSILPGMFQKIDDYTELLLPDYLLRDGSVIQQMIALIPEEDWTDQVQIIGWLYQYYNAEKKDEVFAALKKNVKITKENIPAATQLFTPDWIVRYMVENSLGRLWVEGHPSEELKSNWKYYLEEAEQEPEVQEQLSKIRKEYAALTPEEILCIDPCAGSGHIICYLFDVLVQIYESYGYATREAASLIVEHNLYGLDIDERASQLAYFAVMMKARSYDRRFFSRGVQPHVYAVVESNGLDPNALEYFANGDAGLKQAMRSIVEDMYDAKEYGSILNVKAVDFASLYARFDEISEGIHFSREYCLNTLLPLVQVAEALAQKYHVVVTNPPYMAISNANPKVQKYVKDNFPDSKADMFAIFIERCGQMTAKNCYQAMITQHAWMFLSSFEKLRTKLLAKDTVNMAHLGPRAFEEIGGEVVQTTSFVLSNRHIANYSGTYCRLIDPTTQQGKEDIFLAGENRYVAQQTNFSKIPGSPVAYWVGEAIFNAFLAEKIDKYSVARIGLVPGNNDYYLRRWYEVCFEGIGFGLNRQKARDSRLRWFPYNKAGNHRKWYGNLEYIVNWLDDGNEMQNKLHPSGKRIWAHNFNLDYIFRMHIGWNDITSGTVSFRIYEEGFLFDSSSNAAFWNDGIYNALAFLNSKFVRDISLVLNPTLHFKPGDYYALPYIECNDNRVQKLAIQNISLSRADWNSFETSWDFTEHPLVHLSKGLWDCTAIAASIHYYYGGVRKVSCPLELSYLLWQGECNERFNQLKSNEEELNRIFIDIYGLQDELTPDVADKDVTVRKADLQRDIKSLISYAVGCMFGRYSLDVDGLAYAGGEWDDSKYSAFLPDADAIIPICDDEYFTDDIVGRFEEFIRVVYGADSLDANLRFIADALGGKGTPREVIRNYFINDFYADHCKVYQKRPIYWLFDSGKKGGFKALVYMHRYAPDTIARIRTDYVHEQQARYRTAIADLEQRIANAGTAERVKLNKELTKVQGQADEIRLYEEKIHHLADQMIPIDLDDGVKVNYAKFQDVLAKIK